MPPNEMGLVGGRSPSPERSNDSFMRRRVPSRDKRYPNFADVFLAEEDPAQSRQLMKKMAERTTRHWIARVGSFVREEGVKAPLFVNDVGLSIKHHRVSIESDPNLACWCFGTVLWRHAQSRSCRASSNSFLYVRIHI